jgi:dolichol-phosphate mannosyltransferase
MDDNSQDGIQELVDSMNKPWVHLVVRTKNRGLSQAVLEGLQLAKNEIMVVMDADLSHPPEKIPEMVEVLLKGFDFVIGSRYIKGGSVDYKWSLSRRLYSRVATSFTCLLTSVKDSMSGFFAIRKETFMQADCLSPVGYKICLELLVKCKSKRVCEIPIHFAERQFGESKLGLTERFNYLKHLRRLFIYKYGNWAYFIQFGAVGFTGSIINLLTLTILLFFGMQTRLALAIAIFVAMISNFILNRTFTFSYARKGRVRRQFFSFILACSLGALVNYLTAIGMLTVVPALLPQLAEVVGIIAGTAFNFFFNRYFVFREDNR